MQRKTTTAFATLIAAVIWSGLALHLYGFVQRSLLQDLGALPGVLRFFNYFTNLANLFAAVTMTQWLWHERTANGTNPYQRRMASVLVYVLLAGLIYNVLLRHMLPPHQTLFASNLILHDVVPLLFLAFWGLCIPRTRYGFGDVLSWMKFPIAYFIYVLLIGNKTGRYPYPFMDVTQLGYAAVITNSLQIAAGILLLGLAVIALNRFKANTAAA